MTGFHADAGNGALPGSSPFSFPFLQTHFTMQQLQGMVIQYKRADGSSQKALVNVSDQTLSLHRQAKAIITMLTDDLNVMLDSTDKPVKAIKSLAGTTPIGFFN